VLGCPTWDVVGAVVCAVDLVLVGVVDLEAGEPAEDVSDAADDLCGLVVSSFDVSPIRFTRCVLTAVARSLSCQS
jgi:hypothetical protein